ncbi:MAG TPA: glycosyltransferase family 4 protein, partial [Candidatus Angelobacter sp.]|nr:glycosyltransferase family 4 protein [Candidatus Angelobacter sp.]
LPHTARAFEQRGALAGLWVTEKNSTSLPSAKFRRCLPFALVMQPFYRFTPEIWVERVFYNLFPIWRAWVRAQSIPACNVVHAICGYATEVFDFADGQPGMFRVADCPNSHPMTAYGIWQRECDLWCPGDKVPVPQWMFARQHRELERADLIIVQSKFCMESMVLNGIPAEKVMINPMGVDTSIFKRRTDVPARPRFVCVGAICVRKGHQYLFRAFQKVKQQLPDAELICAGPYRHDFRRERPKWEGTFTHHAHLPHAELAALLQTCTAFVFPSQEEGIARAQMEALASGLPVIGTHEGGATTVMEDGVEGFIVRGRDPDHIASAMVRLAQDRQMNQRMGEAAYLKGAVRNTWQDYGDRLLAEYVKRLGERRVATPVQRDNCPIGVSH